MTDERTISTFKAICIVMVATFQVYDAHEQGIIAVTTPEQQVMMERQSQEAQIRQEQLRVNLARHDVVQQEMSVDPHQAAVSAQQEPSFQDDVRRDEAKRDVLEPVQHNEEEIIETLEQQDDLDEMAKQAPDPVNQAEIRPGPDPVNQLENRSGLEPQDPRLTAMDVRHAERLHRVDAMTRGSETALIDSHQGDPRLEGLLEAQKSRAASYRGSIVSEQAAERQQLLREVYADQQRTFNQQQQFTVPVPPPAPPDLTR